MKPFMNNKNRRRHESRYWQRHSIDKLASVKPFLFIYIKLCVHRHRRVGQCEMLLDTPFLIFARLKRLKLRLDLVHL